MVIKSRAATCGVLRNYSHRPLSVSQNYYHKSLSVSQNYTHSSFSVSQNYSLRSLSLSQNFYHGSLSVSQNYYHRLFSVSQNYCHIMSLSVSQNYSHRSLYVFPELLSIQCANEIPIKFHFVICLFWKKSRCRYKYRKTTYCIHINIYNFTRQKTFNL